MANPPLVKNCEAYENLHRNRLGFRLGLDSIVDHVLAEIAMGDKLHRDMH